MITGNVPIGVVELVVIAKLTETGLPAAGDTELDGWN
jgi:hypothetical protein